MAIKKTINKRPPKKVAKPTKVAPKKAAKKTTKKVVKKLPPKVKVDVPKVKKSDARYLKVSINEPIEKFKEIGERVFRKELKWAYYATENFMGVHYYLILNGKK